MWYQSRRLAVGRDPRSEIPFSKSFPLGPTLFNLTDRFYAKRIHIIFVFQMAEDGPRATAKLHLASPAS